MWIYSCFRTSIFFLHCLAFASLTYISWLYLCKIIHLLLVILIPRLTTHGERFESKKVVFFFFFFFFFKKKLKIDGFHLNLAVHLCYNLFSVICEVIAACNINSSEKCEKCQNKHRLGEKVYLAFNIKDENKIKLSEVAIVIFS